MKSYNWIPAYAGMTKKEPPASKEVNRLENRLRRTTPQAGDRHGVINLLKTR